MKRSILICITLALAITLAMPRLNEASSPDDWTPQKIESHTIEQPPGSKAAIGSTVHFANGMSMKSDLIEMRYIGQLSPSGKNPYLIFSAKSNPWEANTEIFMLSPSKGKLEVTEHNQRFHYPGKLFEHSADHSLVQESRMFFGNCLPRHASVAVWFMKSRLLSGMWKDYVYVAEVQGAQLHTRYLKPPLPAIAEALSLVRGGKCREIPGLDMTEEP